METIDVKKCICLNEIYNSNDLINDISTINTNNQAICKLRCGCDIHTSCFKNYVKCRLKDKVIKHIKYHFIIYTKIMLFRLLLRMIS